MDQGNMNTIHFKNKEILLYDQGSIRNTKFKNIEPRNLLYEQISTVVISHFHIDHYNLINADELLCLNQLLIVKDAIPTTLHQIISKLIFKNKNIKIYQLQLSSKRDEIIKHYDNGIVSVYAGNNRRNQNNRGILINIKIKSQEVF